MAVNNATMRAAPCAIAKSCDAASLLEESEDCDDEAAEDDSPAVGDGADPAVAAEPDAEDDELLSPPATGSRARNGTSALLFGSTVTRMMSVSGKDERRRKEKERRRYGQGEQARVQTSYHRSPARTALDARIAL